MEVPDQPVHQQPSVRHYLPNSGRLLWLGTCIVKSGLSHLRLPSGCSILPSKSCILSVAPCQQRVCILTSKPTRQRKKRINASPSNSLSLTVGLGCLTCRVALHTKLRRCVTKDNAVRCRSFTSTAVEFVAQALDVVECIYDHQCVSAEQSLHSTSQCSNALLFSHRVWQRASKMSKHRVRESHLGSALPAKASVREKCIVSRDTNSMFGGVGRAWKCLASCSAR